MPILIC